MGTNQARHFGIIAQFVVSCSKLPFCKPQEKTHKYSIFKHFALVSFPSLQIYKGTSLVCISLSKHMGDGKLKLGRGRYAISTAILSMYTAFQHPEKKYMLAPGPFYVNFLVILQNCKFEQISTILTRP